MNDAKKYVVDTHILVSMVVKNVRSIQSSEELLIKKFEELSSSQRVIPVFVITEFMTLCQKSLPYKLEFSKGMRAEIIKLATFLSEQMASFANIYFPSFDEYQQALKIFKKSQKENPGGTGISFTDSFVVAVAKEHNWSILTNEKKLKSL